MLARAVAEETLKANRALLQAKGPSRRVLAEPGADADGLQAGSFVQDSGLSAQGSWPAVYGLRTGGLQALHRRTACEVCCCGLPRVLAGLS